MKKIILWIWQLPQNLIGWVMSRFSVSEYKVILNDDTTQTIYFTNNVFGCGISLGNYIILDYKNYYPNLHSFYNYKVYNHEHGHQIQSGYLGWLYLIIVGLPSLVGNMVDRLLFKKLENEKRLTRYYNQPWEKWADKLGGVKR